MTADPPKTVKAAEQSKSSRNPSRSASLNSQHSRSVQSPTTSPSLPPRTPPLPKPQRPRSADSTRTANGNPRDQVGSSRTKYYASQPAHPTSPILAIRGVADSPVDIHTPPRTASIETASTMTEVDMDTPHAPYRPPEAVFEPPEELPPGQVAGIIAEHPISDDDMPSPDSSPLGLKPGPAAGNVDAWRANLQKYNMMHIDEPGVSPERPQIGPGILPRRWLQIAHKHDLFQPVGFDLPTPPPPKKAHTASVSMYEQPISPRPRKPTEPDAVPPPPSPTPSVTTFASLPSLPDYEHISTVADIWDACPGGEGGHHEWYFCPTCWTWVRIVAGQGELPRLAPMEEWEEIVRLKDIYPDTAELDRHRSERMREWSRFNDIKTSKMMAEETHHHMHEFTTLLEPTEEERIKRIPVDPDINAFPHLTVGIDPDDPSWATFTSPSDPPRLSVSCSSDQWMLVDAGPVPGQLPVGLVNAFISEKTTNPGPGMDGNQSVNEALTLISTSVNCIEIGFTDNSRRLLANALFRAQRGWVKLDNKRFQSKIGASVTSYISLMLQSSRFDWIYPGRTCCFRLALAVGKRKTPFASALCRGATRSAKPRFSRWTATCYGRGWRCH